MKIKDLIKIIIFPFIVYMLGYALEIGWSDYHVVLWPNRVVHFLGGLSMAVSGYFVLSKISARGGSASGGKKLKLINTSNRAVDFFIILFFVMSVAVFWEFYEFLSDKYLFTRAQRSVDDTIKDMFMGMLGAISFGVGSVFKLILRVFLDKIRHV